MTSHPICGDVIGEEGTCDCGNRLAAAAAARPRRAQIAIWTLSRQSRPHSESAVTVTVNGQSLPERSPSQGIVSLFTIG